jgi:alpha-tubulin suppressor-like RCC1 family protein
LAAMADYNGTQGMPFIGQFSASAMLKASDPTALSGVQDIVSMMAGYGQSFFLASGDFGGSNSFSCSSGGCDWIQANSYLNLDGVTIVGGTQLSPAPTTSDATVYTESVYNAAEYSAGGAFGLSGGGVLPYAGLPYYQQWMATTPESGGIYISNRQGSTSQRNFPDVAGMAAGIWMLSSCNGQQCWQPATYMAGGTSSASPIWAGFMALVNQRQADALLEPVGFANPAIYAIGQTSVSGGPGNLYSQTFNDVTTGDTIQNNVWGGGSSGYTAVAGYDLATGWGSPRCGLIGQLAAVPTTTAWAIAAGDSHACAVHGLGSVSCWGLNNHGQLGNGLSGNSSVPLAVQGLTDVDEIAAGGYHTCAITANGSAVYCWGGNDYGQLGDGSGKDQPTPVKVAGLSNVVHIAAGYQHTCAIVGPAPMKLMCWGANGNGQIGYGGTTNQPIPVVVPIGYEPTGVALGVGHSCAMQRYGVSVVLQCWGANSHGQLGIGNTTEQHSPQYVGLGFLTMAPNMLVAGANHTCMNAPYDTDGDSQIECWGDNSLGQLGTGAEAEEHLPTAVRAWGTGVPMGFGGLAAGGNHTCALSLGSYPGLHPTRSAVPGCWGENSSGQLGIGNATTPARLSGVIPLSLTDVATIVAGSASTYALTTGGAFAAWGRDVEGQLGDKANNQQDSPEMVTLF